MEKGILQADPQAETILMPMADGGEGTVESIIAATNGKLIKKDVTGPTGEIVQSFYGILPDGKTAIIEMASASGLPLVKKEKRNPLLTTTYGTGEIIKAALDLGCTKLVIGIGGSATNDGGIGMAQALGFSFLDGEGKELPFGGGALNQLVEIDSSSSDKRLNDVEIIVACDVTTVLCGEKGASAVFGPQKGATSEMIEQLDKGLGQLANVINSDLNISLLELKGGGAAGGLGAGLVAFTGATLQAGVDIVLDICKFDELVRGADVVLTGEGMTDFQTAMGKAPVGVARRAKKFKLPVICLSGGLGEGYKEIFSHGIDAAFSIMPFPTTIEKAFENGESWIEDTMESIVRLLKTESIKRS